MLKIVFTTLGYHYIASTVIPPTAYLFALFLVSDVGRDSKWIQLFIEWFEKPASCGAMNATQYNNENGIITFTNEWEDEDEAIKKGWYFQIEAKTAVKVLRGWEQVVKDRPESIEITIDADDVKVVGIGKRAE